MVGLLLAGVACVVVGGIVSNNFPLRVVGASAGLLAGIWGLRPGAMTPRSRARWVSSIGLVFVALGWITGSLSVWIAAVALALISYGVNRSLRGD